MSSTRSTRGAGRRDCPSCPTRSTTTRSCSHPPRGKAPSAQEAEDELGGADRLLEPFALDRRRDRRLQSALDRRQVSYLEPRSDAAPDRERPREAHAIDAVVEREPVPAELRRRDLVPERNEQGQGKEAVRDRRPKRPFRGTRRVD